MQQPAGVSVVRRSRSGSFFDNGWKIPIDYAAAPQLLKGLPPFLETRTGDLKRLRAFGPLATVCASAIERGGELIEIVRIRYRTDAYR